MMFERTICFQSFLFREKQTAKSYMWAEFSLRSSFISESYGSLFFFTAHYSPIQGTIQQSDLNSWVLILCLGFTVCLVPQSCPTVWDSMDHNLPGSSLSMGILQPRILEWLAMPSSRGSSQPRDKTQVSHIAGGVFTVWATREALSWV